MAKIHCPNCGMSVEDDALVCLWCDFPIHQGPFVVVYGYTQLFAVNHIVQVFWNGVRKGSVARGEKLGFGIKADGAVRLTVPSHGIGVRVPVQASHRATDITIVWDRVTGQLIPEVVGFAGPYDP